MEKKHLRTGSSSCCSNAWMVARAKTAGPGGVEVGQHREPVHDAEPLLVGEVLRAQPVPGQGRRVPGGGLGLLVDGGQFLRLDPPLHRVDVGLQDLRRGPETVFGDDQRIVAFCHVLSPSRVTGRLGPAYGGPRSSWRAAVRYACPGWPGTAWSPAKPVRFRRCPATVMPRTVVPGQGMSPDAWPVPTICPRRKGGSSGIQPGSRGGRRSPLGPRRMIMRSLIRRFPVLAAAAAITVTAAACSSTQVSNTGASNTGATSGSRLPPARRARASRSRSRRPTAR